MNQQAVENAKTAVDAITISTAFAAFIGLLPSIAAVFSIIWLAMQMVMNWDRFTLAVRERFKRFRRNH